MKIIYMVESVFAAPREVAVPDEPRKVDMRSARNAEELRRAISVMLAAPINPNERTH